MRNSKRRDAIIGRNIRIFRQRSKITQRRLASRVGVTFQQLQKYENGRNQVGAGRLARIAEALGVPIQSLFSGVKESGGAYSNNPHYDLLSDANAVELSRAFARISDPELRRSIVHFIKNIARKVKCSD
jgi:transcriptional regulator with XRE-family HTH domain